MKDHRNCDCAIIIYQTSIRIIYKFLTIIVNKLLNTQILFVGSRICTPQVFTVKVRPSVFGDKKNIEPIEMTNFTALINNCRKITKNN